MQRMKVLALCVAVLLAFGGLVSAKQGIDVKASVLFGTKLDVDDVVIGADEGTATMEWVSKGDPEATLGQDGDPVGYDNFDLVVSCELGTNAKKVAISPEETGYPMLLEATYGMDKFQIGGFWLGGFKSEGEAAGTVLGLTDAMSDYHAFEQFVFYPLRGDLGTFANGSYNHKASGWPFTDTIDQSTSMLFLGDVPVLPGMYWEYTNAAEGDSADLFTDSDWASLLSATLEIDPDKGASTWEAGVSFNLSNYGGNVGYRLFDQNNVAIALLAGLEQLKWEEEVKGTATEAYDIIVNSMQADFDVYAWDDTADGYVLIAANNDPVTRETFEELVKSLYGGLNTDELQNAGLADSNGLLSNVYLTNFTIDQNSHLNATRELKVTRQLDYNPTGYSVGASAGGLVADKLRVSANFSLGWFSGDAVAKLTVEDERTASFNESEKKGTGTWVKADGEGGYDEVDVDFELGGVDTGYLELLKDGIDGRDSAPTTTEKKHTDTEVTLTRAQVSAEYDITDSVFLGGGFFYSQWKDMPVLSNKSALEIEKQDLVASGVNVEVGVRF